MIKQDYARNLKRCRYFIGGDEYLKLYGVLEDGVTSVRINKKVVDLSAEEKEIELLWCKQNKEIEVDSKTKTVFLTGIYYSAGDKTFSMSESAWINWLDMRHNKENATLTYPYKISCTDGAYSVADATECQTIIDLIFGAKDSILQAGRDLVDSIYASTTISAVEAIIDNR